jgi:hypothetical protein
MNAKQIKVIQTVTKQSWVEYKARTYIEGSLAWSVQDCGDSVYVFGSNTESERGWFSKHTMVQMLIGPLGGIKKFKLI